MKEKLQMKNIDSPLIKKFNRFYRMHSVFNYFYLILVLYLVWIIHDNYQDHLQVTYIVITFFIGLFIYFNFILKLRVTSFSSWIKDNLDNKISGNDIEYIFKKIIKKQDLIHGDIKFNNAIKILKLDDKYNLYKKEIELKDEKWNKERQNFRTNILLIIFALFICSGLYLYFEDYNYIYKSGVEQKFHVYDNGILKYEVIHKIKYGCQDPVGGSHNHGRGGIWFFSKVNEDNSKTTSYTNHLDYIESDNRIKIYNPYNLNKYPHPIIYFPLIKNKTYNLKQYLYENKFVPSYFGGDKKISLDRNKLLEIKTRYTIIDTTYFYLNNQRLLCWEIKASSDVYDKYGKEYSTLFLFNNDYGFIDLNYLNDSVRFELIQHDN